MEQFLAAADERANIVDLREFIRSNKPLLQDLAVRWAGYTPLHVACAAGRLNLVQALLTLMPEFAEETDTDGLSPLHIAAARGHAEIADELLRGRPRLCFVKGLENRIPLHYAIENGNLAVMRVLLSNSPGSVKETTTRKETALHLALKNNQFDAFSVLLEHLRQYNMEEVINRKDNKGNTALHLAVAVQNLEVVNFMLDEHALWHEVVDVNACNESGRTPLDFSGWGAGNREIREILNRAGAIRGRGRDSSLVLEGESKTDTRNALLVVAGLIVNATYQSVLQPPRFTTKVDNTNAKGFLASYASLMTGFLGRDLAYIFFISGNTFGLLVSVQMIICLTRDLPFKRPLLISMAVMVQTYYGHTKYLPFTSLEKEFSLKNVELFTVLPLTIPILLLLLQKPLARALESSLEQLSLFDHLRDMYDFLT